jgi:RimJ/RimL family protein N-acetyltransferase
MFPLLSDRQLYQFTGGEPPGSQADVAKWFTALESRLSPDGAERWLTWIVQLVESSVSIGYVQATVKEGNADIAWLIGIDWQGQGYATEATRSLVDWLNENQIYNRTAHIHADHLVSQRVAFSLGLHRSGLLHEQEEIWSSKIS